MGGHLFEEPPPITTLTGGVPGEIVQIIARSLVKDKEDRYQSVGDVLSDLGDVAAARPPRMATTLDQTRPRGLTLHQSAGAPDAASTETRRKRPSVLVYAAAGAAAIALAVGGALVAQTLMDDGEDLAAAARTDRPPAEPAPSPEPDEPVPPTLDTKAVKGEARALIRGALGDVEPAVRVSACTAVGEVRDQPSIPELVDLTRADPDAEVRGRAATALAALGASDHMDTLAALARDAAPGLQVSYAEALLRLGRDKERRTLLRYAGKRDLGVSFAAATALAELSEPGDRKVRRALEKLVRREAELNDIAPYAGVTLLAHLARLGHDKAYDTLRQTLQHSAEPARLAAAEALARLGDESGTETLRAVLGDSASPNRPVAAAALIALGDYSGYDLLTETLTSDDAELRRLSARGLGRIGERDSLGGLLDMYSDADKRVRVAAATAVLHILGLDPLVLAQASVDWARSALDSDDWAVRKAAARTLGDIPEDEAMPLLAQAIIDPEPEVRRSAARSAARMKSPEAAREIAAAAVKESDKEVKEEQIIALAKIGSPEVKDTLENISNERGRVGVLALGSLIAIGDTTSVERLDRSYDHPASAIRMATMESAALADNRAV
ncbi:MAG: HEAT repeat domain-containing protein, partial [Myxococcota bacterium]